MICQICDLVIEKSNMSFNLLNALILIIMYQALLFAILLWLFKNGKGLSNIILSVFTFFIAFHSVTTLLVDLKIIANFTYGVVPSLLYGPLLLLYSKSLIFNSYSIVKQEIKHFIFPLLAFILLCNWDYKREAYWR